MKIKNAAAKQNLFFLRVTSIWLSVNSFIELFDSIKEVNKKLCLVLALNATDQRQKKKSVVSLIC